MSLSLKQKLGKLPPAEREAALRFMAEQADCSLDELATALLSDWGFHGRPEQQPPPGNWKIWLVMTGRRWGKTRTAAEWIHKRVNSLPKSAGSTGGLLQRTSSDLRDIMIEGPSGLLATAKPGFPVKYEPSKKKVSFHNGYVMNCYSAEEPDALRGPTLSTLWADEFASLKTVTGIDGLTAFDNALFALSAPVPGDRPRGIITTTPRRVKSVKKILAEASARPRDFAVTHGSLMDNVDNLDPTSVQELLTKFAGTSLGSQELDGILTTDLEGAPFKSSVFNATRIDDPDDVPSLSKTVIAVDPSTGDGTGDECGISVVGISAGLFPTTFEHKGLTVVRNLRHIYILEDASIAGPPDMWAARVAAKADEYGTTTVVAEGNQGGQMVKTTIRSADPGLKVKVVNARVGKEARAEPVAALFAQGRAHLVGEQPEMEDQATTHVAGAKDSPDRMDAMVWGVTFLEPAATRQSATQTVDPALYEQTVASAIEVKRDTRSWIASPDSGDWLSRHIG
jgi:phage terminase large subunit-like protein